MKLVGFKTFYLALATIEAAIRVQVEERLRADPEQEISYLVVQLDTAFMRFPLRSACWLLMFQPESL